MTEEYNVVFSFGEWGSNMKQEYERKLQTMINSNKIEMVRQAIELAEALDAGEKWFQENLEGFLWNYLARTDFEMSEIEYVLSLVKTYSIKRFQRISVFTGGAFFYHIQWTHFEPLLRKGLPSLSKKCLAAVREYCDSVGLDSVVGDILFGFNGDGSPPCTMEDWGDYLTEYGSYVQAKKFILGRIK